MTPRAQGQEKMNSALCPRHAPSERASLLFQVGFLTLCTKAVDSTHCTQLHPEQATYRSSFREPCFQMQRNKAQVSPAHTAPEGWQSAPGFDP